jgi:type IV pilus assembly protein PilN
MIKINLLAVRETKKKETLQQQVVLAVFVVILTLGAIGYFHVNITNKIKDVTGEKAEVDKKVKSLKKEIGDLQDLKKKAADLDNKKSVINELEVERNGPVHIFEELANATPPELWIDDFLQKGKDLTIKGYAADNETIANFMRNLNSSPYFSGVSLVKSEKSKSGSLTVNVFTLKMKIKYL